MIDFNDDIDLDSLNSTLIEQDLVDEASQRAARRTVPTGEYKIQGTAITVKKDDRDPAQFKRAIPGRTLGRVQADVFDALGEKCATVFFDVSHEPMRYESANHQQRLDTPSLLYLQAAKAFGTQNAKDTYEAFEKYPLTAFIMETAKTGAGVYVKLRKGESEKHDTLAAEGAAFYNDVLNVKAVA